MKEFINYSPKFTATQKNVFSFNIVIFYLILMFTIPTYAAALNDSSYVSFVKGSNKFSLSESGKSASVIVSSNDFPGVIRIAKQLQFDIGSVTGASPELSIDAVSSTSNMVIIGTIGNSSLIDGLIANKKLDVKNIEGKWDTFLIQIIEKPFPNVDRAMVIVFQLFGLKM
jgi:hypothetical protein